jgi:hypothetical protein
MSILFLSVFKLKCDCFYTTDTFQLSGSVDCQNTAYFSVNKLCRRQFWKLFNPVLCCKNTSHYVHITMQTGLHFYTACCGNNASDAGYSKCVSEVSLTQAARTDGMMLALYRSAFEREVQLRDWPETCRLQGTVFSSCN